MPTIPALLPASPTAPGPDYELDEYVEASTPAQLKAIGHRTRATILDLVLERAATTTELAKALGQPKGTVGHHLKVLEAAGLVRVVATRQVRALTAKYYGRTGRTIVIKGDYLGAENLFPMLSEAMAEASEAVGAGVVGGRPRPCRRSRSVTSGSRRRRAAAFAERLHAVAIEFSELPRGGDTVYGLIAGMYPTIHPVLVDRPRRSR